MMGTRRTERNFHVFKADSRHRDIKAVGEIRAPWNPRRARRFLWSEIAKSVNRETLDASLSPGCRLRSDMYTHNRRFVCVILPSDAAAARQSDNSAFPNSDEPFHMRPREDAR